MTVKPTKPPHFSRVDNRSTFNEAYAQILKYPDREYFTSGNATPFKAVATIGKQGNHAGEKVIRFFTHGTEKARSCPCCWGFKTNCNRTYIDCFTETL
jgi:hypothetical protein